MWTFEDFGCVTFAQGLVLQQQARERLQQDERLIACMLGLTHPPTITLGRRANRANILLSEAALAARGYALINSDRGGDVTYHGPEQVIVYPIFHLERARMGVRAWVSLLEQALIDYLATLQITAVSDPASPGVYIENPHQDCPRAKIAFIGLRVIEGICMHGIALNLQHAANAHFQLIHPCGMPNITTTSVQSLTGANVERHFSAKAIADAIARRFDSCRLHT